MRMGRMPASPGGRRARTIIPRLFFSALLAAAAAESLFRLALRMGLARTTAAIETKDSYGFNLWSSEGGHPTAINNRYGFPDRDFELEKAPGVERAAIIGDSFVEALQVEIPEKMGPVLQSLLDRGGRRKFEALSFGRSWEYPGYYLERLKFSLRFSPDVIFVVFFMGNDFRNASMEIENRSTGMTPDRYIFYTLDGQGGVRPHPASLPVIAALERGEETVSKRRRPLLERADLLLRRSSLLYSELPFRLEAWRRGAAPPPATAAALPAESGRPRPCTEESIYVKSYGRCWRDSIAINRALIARMRRLAEGRGARFCVIGIPANETFWGDLPPAGREAGEPFPPPRYAESLAASFSVPLEDVDLSNPDRYFKEMMSGTGARSIDLLDRFREDAAASGRSPYRRWFYGHLSESGHRLVAAEMARFIREGR